MMDTLSNEKRSKITEVQEFAEEHLDGENRFTNILLWDDDDFKIEVVHGLDEQDKREKILYRSNGNHVYPGETILYIVEEMTVSEEGKMLEIDAPESDMDISLESVVEGWHD